jgi:hypothetical protein
MFQLHTQNMRVTNLILFDYTQRYIHTKKTQSPMMNLQDKTYMQTLQQCYMFQHHKLYNGVTNLFLFDYTQCYMYTK